MGSVDASIQGTITSKNKMNTVIVLREKEKVDNLKLSKQNR